MLYHHLKLAFRNLRKYKTQNIISIIGLAVGFTCFAFSALWIRYEMSYDSFHPKADRIYRVQVDSYKWTMGTSVSLISSITPYPLAGYLKSNFPEIEDACGIFLEKNDNYSFLYIDPSFCNIFDMTLPEDFFIKGLTEKQAAITNVHKDATKFIEERFNYVVRTIIPHWQANTNINFDIVVPTTLHQGGQLNSWNSSMYHTYILIKNGVNVQDLEKKLDKIEFPERLSPDSPPVSLVLTPLKQLRYKDPAGNYKSDIKFNHIRIFAIAGLLVILCSLFNHLTLYVTRVQMRLRELALRKVNGATDRQIAAMLYTDFLLVILLSLVSGFMLMAWLLPTFKEYATIGNNVNIYLEMSLYAFLLIIFGFVACVIPILYFRMKVLNDSIKGKGYGSPESRNLFRKGCLLLQLIISLGLIFCSTVFIKQIHFLNHTDLGINRRNIAHVSAGCCPLPPHYADRIRQIPGIIDALPVTHNSFLRNMANVSSSSSYEKNGETISYTIFWIQADAHFFDFFGVEIIEGTGISNNFDFKIVLNETAMKELGDVPSIRNQVIGVARDFYLTPTAKINPTLIRYPDPGQNSFRTIVYKYEEGQRQQTQQAITKWMRDEFPDQGEFVINFTYMEDVFEKHFKSERALLTLLSVLTFACILIAVFGVYSLTGLTCRQRRKEIAIRKINGAEVSDIMNIFFKEYLILLALAALTAFPAGYLIMKRWLEGYVKQTSMDAWLYVAIFLMVFAVIVFSIVYMVWKAANKNPAEVVKAD